MNIKKTLLIFTLSALYISLCQANNQILKKSKKDIPRLFRQHIKLIDNEYYYILDEKKHKLVNLEDEYNLDSLIGRPIGSDSGILFNFSGINGVEGGRLYAGLIPFKDMKYPYPVFRDKVIAVKDGKADFPFSVFENDPKDPSSDYDLIDWEMSGNGTLGYRLLDVKGNIMYDGKIGFIGKKGGPFKVNNASIILGPLVNLSVNGNFNNEIRISFTTYKKTHAEIEVVSEDENFHKIYKSNHNTKDHEVTLIGLQSETKYDYTVKTNTNDGKQKYSEKYYFKTAPAPGSDKPFKFAFSSDGRTGGSGIGGGMRFLTRSINAYILKKMNAYNALEDIDFFQFTGDLISGYDTRQAQHEAEFVSWRRTIEPFAHYYPVIASIGNHDAALSTIFADPKIDISSFPKLTGGIAIDKFPYKTHSAEAIWAKHFVNPENGPESEDGQHYDPERGKMNFPTYKENVFYYTWGNTAIVSLNSDYWYSANLDVTKDPQYIGGLHGYIMDGQMQWYKEIMNRLSRDGTIAHVFVTIHTPAFPNSGHIINDMWYNGNNNQKPVVLNKHGENLIKTGIIEQRDKFLLITMNNPKVRMIITGDEHNFCMTDINKTMNMYPKNWKGRDITKLPTFRPIIEMVNGAAGAPYYAQGKTPWTDHTKYFTTQNALAVFYIEGSKTPELKVINPDTLETIIEKTPIDQLFNKK
ncbi:MAG: metallophosphoesterase family protein [bacterium]|nr:metallophosphoesterase family protein [bacterium]